MCLVEYDIDGVRALVCSAHFESHNGAAAAIVPIAPWTHCIGSGRVLYQQQSTPFIQLNKTVEDQSLKHYPVNKLALM